MQTRAVNDTNQISRQRGCKTIIIDIRKQIVNRVSKRYKLRF